MKGIAQPIFPKYVDLLPRSFALDAQKNSISSHIVNFAQKDPALASSQENVAEISRSMKVLSDKMNQVVEKGKEIDEKCFRLKFSISALSDRLDIDTSKYSKSKKPLPDIVSTQHPFHAEWIEFQRELARDKTEWDAKWQERLKGINAKYVVKEEELGI